MPSAMQTMWKPRPGSSSPIVVKPGVWEKTPPNMDTIQINPSSRKSMPPTRKTPFIV